MNPKIKKIIRAVALLVFLALGIKILSPHLESVPESIAALKQLNYWALAVAVFFEFLRFMSCGYLINVIIGLFNDHVSSWDATTIAMASSSFGMVAGGMVGSIASSAGWLRKKGVNLQAASMAGFLPILFNNLAVLILSLVGVIYLLGMDALTKPQMNAFLVILILLLSAFILIFLFLKKREKSKIAAIKIIQWYTKTFKKPFDEEKSGQQLDEIFDMWDLFIQKGWKKPLLASFMIYGFDLLALFFLFMAANHPISPRILLIGYGLPQLLGKAAFVIPGGVGVVEGTMISLYQQLGISNPVAVVVVLSYRFLTFLLPAIIGFLLVVVLQRDDVSAKSPI